MNEYYNPSPVSEPAEALSEATPQPVAAKVSAENWADGKPRPVDPNSVTVARLVGALWVAILAFVTLIPLLILVLMTALPPWARGVILLGWFGLFSFLGVLSLVWPVWRYRRLRWWLDAQGVHIQRGVLWREQIAVPASRIQHTDVSQGPLDRSYGIASLIVHTAGTVNAAVTLGGLSHGVALQLRDLLLASGEDDGV